MHGHLRDAGQRSSLLIDSVSKIANDENIREIEDREVAVYFDSSAAIRLRIGALGKLPAEGRGGDSAGPEDGLRRQHFVGIPALEGDAPRIDVGHHHAFDDFDSETRD